MANSISAIVEEASFEATSEGLSFRAMDPSHVALVDLFWPSAAFEKYECDRQLKFTVRVEDLNKLIRRSELKDGVEVSVGEEQVLNIKFTNSYSREYKLHLLESASSPTPLPKLSFNSKINFTGSTFQRILNDISVVSDHITLHSLKDRVTFSGKSDAGNASAALEKSNAELLELEVKEESLATYSIEYLMNITKAAAGSADVVSFEYSSKMPLRLEFKLGEQGGKIHFYLAPRIEER